MIPMRLVLFVLGVNAIAWGSLSLIGIVVPNPKAASSIGVSIATLGPLCMAALLRLAYKEDWDAAGLKPLIKGNVRWYAFAIAFPLSVIGMVFVSSLALGFARLAPDHTAGLSTLLMMSGILIVPTLLASVGEEFGWRGYLEPHLQRRGGSVMLNHAVVGVVWGVWHWPIIIFSAPHPGAWVLVMTLVGCVALAVIYGQLRLLSGSVWPCVCLHAASNTLTASFAMSRLLLVDAPYRNIVSLNTTSVAVTGLWIATSLVFLVRHQRRTWSAPQGVTA